MMELHVYHPDSHVNERAYILRELLGRERKVSLQFHAEPRSDTVITSYDGRRLTVEDGLLGLSPSEWLSLASMPVAPLRMDCPEALNSFSRIDPGLPILRQHSDNATYYQGDILVSGLGDTTSLHLHADLFGSAFFFLSRYEEVAAPVFDSFGRFPAMASYAFRHGFLDRPVVDEYRALLDACLNRLWPNLPPDPAIFRIEVSHDVDLPLRHAWANWARMLGGGFRDFVQTRSVAQFRERAIGWHAVRYRQQYERDPYNTFAELMNCSEKRGLRSAFYFIADRPAGHMDALYEIDDPFIVSLISQIHGSGHEVGLHTSFNSFLDAEQTQHEFDRLRTVCERQGVRQQVWGGRQHFLRWKAPETLRNWEAAGLNYDATLGFAQCVGFRCGTSREFRPFDLLWQRTLNLVERPLIVMDATLINYMRLGTGDAALATCEKLKRYCEKHEGIFSLLWHNSNLTSPDMWRLYLDILDC